MGVFNKIMDRFLVGLLRRDNPITPGEYRSLRNDFIAAFELNDTQAMEEANDKMKSIEIKAGIINNVDIIERLMQIKKVKR